MKECKKKRMIESWNERLDEWDMGYGRIEDN
jgi:hypothetical protein